ncbi:MAG: hypothetical protein HQ481_19675 [Alphaproteobacteria bacterium]|nr:hypothetical protein [Alphaproteobacteria bacterium]
MPIAVVPVRNTALRKARLIKNVRLETRVELFREAGVGSGQIAIDEIPDFFGGEEVGLEQDLTLLRQLGLLPAFDPYTLRIGLRQAGIDVLALEAFELSSAKKAELFPLMTSITRPLLAHIYGGDKVDPTNLEELIGLVVEPDTPQIRERLHVMARRLDTTIEKLPNMLEDYGDTYLALSYYRGYFRYTLPVVDQIIAWMREIEDSSILRSDVAPLKTFKQVEDVLTYLTRSISERFDGFDNQTVVHWDRVNLDTFKGVRELIAKHQRSLGEVLCGLTVKVYEWEAKFPNGGGSPDKRLEFISVSLKPGLDELWATERRAPKFDNRI